MGRHSAPYSIKNSEHVEFIVVHQHFRGEAIRTVKATAHLGPFIAHQFHDFITGVSGRFSEAAAYVELSIIYRHIEDIIQAALDAPSHGVPIRAVISGDTDNSILIIEEIASDI
ncbi:MAG: hypothetical protein IPJ00_20660 [Saprospirales bacterium]|nr:hypothetical protein [Saprospirales bacterium]